MEYELRRLDPRYQLSIMENEPALAEFDCLAHAVVAAHNHYQKTQEPVGVWQPALNGFREKFAPWLEQDE